MMQGLFHWVNDYLPCNGEVDNSAGPATTAQSAVEVNNLPERQQKIRSQSTNAQNQPSIAKALHTVTAIFDSNKRGIDNPHIKDSNKPIELLLLGAAQSGKSTFFRQLQLLHGKCFTTERERLIYRPIVSENLLSAMDILVNKMPMYQISFTSPGCEKNLEEFRAFIDHYKSSPEFNKILGRQDLNDSIMNPTNLEELDNTPLPMSLGLSITQLWEDPGVQQIYGLSHQFQLNETAKYFLDNAKRICNNEYVPTIKDILHVRLKTTGSTDFHFNCESQKFRVIDVGGQRCERTKWLSYFDEVHGVIYIASLNGYNLKIEEDNTQNRLIESINLFYILASSSYFANTPFILFLNKTDLFRKKLEKYPLRICFEHYKGLNKYEPAISYVEERFRAHFQRSRDKATKSQEFGDTTQKYRPLQQPPKEGQNQEDNDGHMSAKRLYVHRTCGTDTKQMEFVFNALADIIMESTLSQIGLS